jgi:hypothetical protein
MTAPTARFGGAGGHFYSQKHLAPLLGAIKGATSTIQCRAERHSLCPWSAYISPSTWPHWELPKGMGRGPAQIPGMPSALPGVPDCRGYLRAPPPLEGSVSRAVLREVERPRCAMRGIHYNGAFHVS